MKAKLRGRKHTLEARAKMRLAKQGKPGREHTPESRAKISATMRARHGLPPKSLQEHRPRKKRAINNIRSKHRWVARHRLRTGVCEHCRKRIPPLIDRLGRKHTGTVFANISGKYKLDVDDYLELCRPCHNIYDGV